MCVGWWACLGSSGGVAGDRRVTCGTGVDYVTVRVPPRPAERRRWARGWAASGSESRDADRPLPATGTATPSATRAQRCRLSRKRKSSFVLAPLLRSTLPSLIDGFLKNASRPSARPSSLARARPRGLEMGWFTPSGHAGLPVVHVSVSIYYGYGQWKSTSSCTSYSCS